MTIYTDWFVDMLKQYDRCSKNPYKWGYSLSDDTVLITYKEACGLIVPRAEIRIDLGYTPISDAIASFYKNIKPFAVSNRIAIERETTIDINNKEIRVYVFTSTYGDHNIFVDKKLLDKFKRLDNAKFYLSDCKHFIHVVENDDTIGIVFRLKSNGVNE